MLQETESFDFLVVTSLLVSSITIVGLPLLPGSLVYNCNDGVDDDCDGGDLDDKDDDNDNIDDNDGDDDHPPIPPNGDGSRAALAIGATVDFAEQDAGDEVIDDDSPESP